MPYTSSRPEIHPSHPSIQIPIPLIAPRCYIRLWCVIVISFNRGWFWPLVVRNRSGQQQLNNENEINAHSSTQLNPSHASQCNQPGTTCLNVLVLNACNVVGWLVWRSDSLSKCTLMTTFGIVDANVKLGGKSYQLSNLWDQTTEIRLTKSISSFRS